MSERLKPLRLFPAGKGYIWGGERLKKEYNKHLDISPLAESWECSVHPDGMSLIDGGEDDKYAREHEGDNGKTEFWYVLDAEEGAELVYGFEHPMNREKLIDAIDDGKLEKMLHHIPVHKGDVFFVYPGTVHAIGKGIVLVEVQESSNVTYSKRPLHIERAADVLDMSPVRLIRQPQRMVRYYYGCARELLCRCEYFEVERIQVTKGFSFSVLDSSFQVLLCIDGNGGLETDETNKPFRFAKGACLFLPAGLGRCHIIGDCVLLKVRC